MGSERLQEVLGCSLTFWIALRCSELFPQVLKGFENVCERSEAFSPMLRDDLKRFSGF